ncbi:MAG: DUF47 family protein [Clostridiales Family XIII bacterium]|jgi:uncharacterized protein Yka (UPF0111/DUF47 family)|nr:DUF47 family protein [Clostridiales Family XIII bacterium]
MFGNKGEKYHESFIEMGSYACDAAVFLKEVITHYDPAELDRHMEKMHAIEHDGDIARHTLMRRLLKDNRPPFDREDILHMSDAIDQVTDSIEDVLLRLYMFDVKVIRPEARETAELIVRCTKALQEALTEFAQYKTSKLIQEKLIEVNRLEEEGDALYTKAVRGVYTEEGVTALHADAWHHLYAYMEDVCDACEDAADVIEAVMMKNA